MRMTKAWLNELDGSSDDARFDGATEASASLASRPDSFEALRRAWRTRDRGR
jgi:hypothetical protein